VRLGSQRYGRHRKECTCVPYRAKAPRGTNVVPRGGMLPPMVSAPPIVGLVASSSARAAQAPRDRHSGEHRPGALVFEKPERHSLIAESGGRGDGVSGAGAGSRLDDRHVGRRPPLTRERLELSQFSRGEVDRREEARTAEVSDERLPRVAHAGPAGDGDLRAAGGETRQDAEPGVLRGGARIPSEFANHGDLIAWQPAIAIALNCCRQVTPRNSLRSLLG